MSTSANLVAAVRGSKYRKRIRLAREADPALDAIWKDSIRLKERIYRATLNGAESRRAGQAVYHASEKGQAARHRFKIKRKQRQIEAAEAKLTRLREDLRWLLEGVA